MDPDHDQQLERVRQKYYDNLEELEDKEKRWGETEYQLYRNLARLALAVYGAHPTVDERLDELRDAVRDRKDAAHVENLIGRVHEAASVLEKREPTPELDPLPVYERLLESLPLPPPLRRRGRRLRRQLERSVDDAGAEALAGEFESLLREAVTGGEAPAADAGKPSRPVLGRLFRSGEPAADSDPRGQAAEVESPPPSGAETVRRLLTRLELPEWTARRIGDFERRAATVETRADLDGVIDDVARFCSSALESPATGVPAPAADGVEDAARLLLDLLERLGLPEELAGQLRPARARLASGVSRGDLGDVVEEIASTVTEMRARLQTERAALQDLLLGVTGRLQEMDQFLLSVEASRSVSNTGRQELADDFSEQLRNLRSEAGAVRDVNVLRELVDRRINTIEKHVGRFLESEEAQSRALEHEVLELSSSLTETMAETERLRGELERQAREARLDGLTGVPNRSAYDVRVDEEHARWRRYRTPLTLMVWDIDRFKTINDTFGHQAGDKVIRSVARLIGSRIRKTDFLARYGGEEFVVLMPETTREDGYRVAESLRVAVENTRFHHREIPVEVTASCGIAEFAGDDDPDSVFRRADRALYRAKESGRNRVEVDETPHQLQAVAR